MINGGHEWLRQYSQNRSPTNAGTEAETEKPNSPESETKVAASGVRGVAMPYGQMMSHLEGATRGLELPVTPPRSLLRMKDLPFDATVHISRIERQ